LDSNIESFDSIPIRTITQPVINPSTSPTSSQKEDCQVKVKSVKSKEEKTSPFMLLLALLLAFVLLYFLQPYLKTYL